MNPQHLGTRLHLEGESLWKYLNPKEVLRAGPNPKWLVSVQTGNLDVETDRHRGQTKYRVTGGDSYLQTMVRDLG